MRVTLHYMSIKIDINLGISVYSIILVEVSNMGLEHKSQLRMGWRNSRVICI